MTAALARRPWSAGALLTLVTIAAPAVAHDSWLVAEANAIPTPGTVALTLITSDDFPHPDAPTLVSRVQRFACVRDAGRGAIRDVEAGTASLGGVLDAPMPGMYTAAIALHPRFIEIEGEAFSRYLETEKATAALSMRASGGAQSKPGLELYTKYSKTFVEVGVSSGGPPQEADKAAAGSSTRPVGHALEIVPLTNPCRWRAGDRVTVRVLLDGQLAAGLFVSSGREDGGKYESTIRTDAQGLATFTFGRSGLWYLRTHVIRPLKDVPPDAENIPEGKTPEWASFFASMTFRVVDR